jgi:hypothetical protein
MDADKFHANCYSYSGAVASTHYLLRQKPYRVMWGGHYVVAEKNIGKFSRTEDLLGLSTYMDYEYISRSNENLQEKDWFDKAKFIGENNKLWKRINVREKALEYFDWKNRHRVKYNGYLLNHTQKLAVDLSKYLMLSMFRTKEGEIATIDLIPPLTETGGGTGMALFEGISTDSTEELSTTWCGDLLQIVDELPNDYKLIDCCFAEDWDRSTFCCYMFGVDASNFVLNDCHGNRYKGAALNFSGKRGEAYYIKIEGTGDEIKILYVPEREPKLTDALIAMK